MLGIVLLAFGSQRSASAQSVMTNGSVNPIAAVSPNWTVGGSLIIGESGMGTLNVEDGGSVRNTTGRIGNAAGSVGSVMVTGSGSTWENSNSVYVGENGTGTLNVADGGSVINVNGVIGNALGSAGTVAVMGSGSTWTTSGSLLVGNNGTGTLTVEDDGSVNSGSGAIGSAAASVGTATVMGPGSTWTTSGSLFVGNDGTGTLSVTDGGAVSTANGYIGDGSTSAGTVTVTGPASIWANSGDLGIGLDGTGTLSVEDGGSVSTTDGYIGYYADSVGAAAVISSGSTWALSGALTVGMEGTGTLSVTDGGSISSSNVYIGASTAGSIGIATVTGLGSTLNVSGDFVVGMEGTGTLTVEAGGSISNTDGSIGSSTVGSTGTAIVTGTRSTWANSGSLQIGGFGTGTLSIANGGTVSVGGGVGTVILAEHAGSTGTLNIGAASGAPAAAAGTLDAAGLHFGDGTGTVIFNHAGTTRDAALQFALGISGNGRLVSENGWTFLSGDSSGFTGTTNITGGTFSVNGLLGGTTFVSYGSRLQGSGMVGTTVLSSGATLAPGNSIGILTVNGDLAFASGSIYEAEIAANGTSDKVVVLGTAYLNGAGVSVSTLDPTVSYRNGQPYTIVQAGMVDGIFAAPTIAGGSAFLTPSLAYGPTTVTLNIATVTTSITPTTPVVPAPLFVTAAATANQFAAAYGLDGLPQTAGSGSLILYNAILFSNAPNARVAFDQLSGEVHASAKTGEIKDTRFIANTAMDRLGTAFAVLEEQGSDPVEGSLALASTGIEAWIASYGSWGETDGDGNAAALDRDIGGFLVGADGFVTETLRVGLLAGYSEASYDVDGRTSSTDVDSTHLGVYAGTMLGPVALKAGASYSFNEINTAREIAFSTFRDSVTANYDSRTAQVFGEASYRIDTGFGTAISPLANLTYVSLDTDDFSERGGAAALRSNDDTTETTFSTLGLKGQVAMQLGGRLAANADATLGWRHAYEVRTPPSTLAFIAGGPNFVVTGVPVDKDAAVVELGFGVDIAPNASFGLRYAGQFAEDASDNGLHATLDVKF